MFNRTRVVNRPTVDCWEAFIQNSGYCYWSQLKTHTQSCICREELQAYVVTSSAVLNQVQLLVY